MTAQAAKADGRWRAAYDSPRNASLPEDFLEGLEKNKKAKAFFATLNKANIYAISYRLQTAKRSETKEKRFEGAFYHVMARGDRRRRS